MNTPLRQLAAQDVAAFLGQGDDPSVVALAGAHLPIITSMATAYTRGAGVDPETGFLRADLAAVVVAATARLVANPEQTLYETGNVRMKSYFQGWTLAELSVLNRYRKRAQ